MIMRSIAISLCFLSPWSACHDATAVGVVQEKELSSKSSWVHGEGAESQKDFEGAI